MPNLTFARLPLHRPLNSSFSFILFFGKLWQSALLFVCFSFLQNKNLRVAILIVSIFVPIISFCNRKNKHRFKDDKWATLKFTRLFLTTSWSCHLIRANRHSWEKVGGKGQATCRSVFFFLPSTFFLSSSIDLMANCAPTLFRPHHGYCFRKKK